jgi:two-component system sensor histidine kinase HydH
MKGDNKRHYLIYILFFLSYCALMSLIILLLSGESARTRIILEYEAERTAAMLMESLLSEGFSDDFKLPDAVAGFGIYQAGGEKIITRGSAPSHLDPAEIKGIDHRFTYNRTKKSIILIRRIGRPHMEDEMSPHMHQRMRRHMGPAPPFPFGYGQQIIPEEFLSGQNILFFELNAAQTLSRIHSHRFIGFIIGIILFAVMIGLIILYRKNRGYRKKLESHEQLIRLGEMARVLAHEIKNPLGAIKIQTAYLKKILPEDKTRDLSIIDEEIERLSVLTNRISDFMRDPGGTPEKINLIPFIETLLKRFDSLITFTVMPAEDVSQNTGNTAAAAGTHLFDDTIFFDRDRLRSVLENVINNAIQSTEGESKNQSMPELVLKENKKYLVLSVLDRGKGIQPSDREKAFDPFFTTRAKGSGIGLSITRRFLLARGGSISLLPREGGGTEAKLFFRRCFEGTKNTHR